MHDNNIKKSRFRNPIFLTYVILFLVFFLSLSYGYNNRYNDDVIFYKLVYSKDSIFDFLASRYSTWSSRLIIEAIVALFSVLPLVAFRLFFSLILCLVCYYYCLLQNNLSIKQVISVDLLILSFPLFYLSDTGFIATGLNYVLPVLGLLMTALPLINVMRNESVNKWQWCLCILGAIVCSNFEITAIVLFTLSLLLNVKLMASKRKPYIFVNIISFIGILFSVSCPGNSIRTTYEIENNFPIFSSWNTLDKITNGIFHGLIASFTNTDTKFFIACMLIIIMIKNFNAPKKFLLTSAALLFCLISSIVDQLFPTFFTQDFNALYNGTVADNIYLCVLLVAFLLTSISLLNAFDDIRVGFIYLLIFFAGACSFIIIGFSPTIIASGYRVFNFMIFAVIFCISGIINETTISSKKQVVMFLPIILIFIRMIFNNINYLTYIRNF